MEGIKNKIKSFVEGINGSQDDRHSKLTSSVLLKFKFQLKLQQVRFQSKALIYFVVDFYLETREAGIFVVPFYFYLHQVIRD